MNNKRIYRCSLCKEKMFVNMKGYKIKLVSEQIQYSDNTPGYFFMYYVLC